MSSSQLNEVEEVEEVEQVEEVQDLIELIQEVEEVRDVASKSRQMPSKNEQYLRQSKPQREPLETADTQRSSVLQGLRQQGNRESVVASEAPTQQEADHQVPGVVYEECREARLPPSLHEKPRESWPRPSQDEERKRPSLSNVVDGVLQQQSVLEAMGRHPEAGSAYEDSNFEANMNEVDKVKAMTMHELVEVVTDKEGITRKVVFMTNNQAKIVLRSPDRIKRLVEALELPEAKLVISVMTSIDPSLLLLEDRFWAAPDLPGLECMCTEKGHMTIAWRSRQEFHECERRLARFMREVLLPLAVETHAVIAIDAHHGQCQLAATLGRVVAQERAQWGGNELPFTVLGLCNAQPLLYKNEDLMAFWRSIKRGCKNWKARNGLMVELMAQNEGWGFSCDLDPNATHYVILDSIDESKGGRIGDLGPGNLLLAEVINHLKKNLPVVCIKTGMTWKEKLGERYCSGLSVPLDALAAGTPVVFLDQRLRERAPNKIDQPRNARALVNQAMKQYMDDAVQYQLPDVSDVSALSHFHSLLKGGVNRDSSTLRVPLHRALSLLEENAAAQSRIRDDTAYYSPGMQHSVEEASPFSVLPICGDSGRALPGMSPEFGEEGDKLGRRMSHHQDHMPEYSQYLLDEHVDSSLAFSREETSRTLQFLCQHFYNDCWRRLPPEKKQGNFDDRFGAWMDNWMDQTEILFSRENLWSLNVADISRASECLRELAKMDRLPASNTKSGLRLLRRAWDHIDKANYLASKFKCEAKFTFGLQMLLQIVLVVISVINTGNGTEDDEGRFTAAAFAVSLIVSSLMAFHAVRSPASRWRQLRANALQMQSNIWQYRCRVGSYATSVVNPEQSDQALHHTLQDWVDRLFSAADLKQTDIGRKYPESIYKHFQYKGELKPVMEGSEYFDDHQSPVHPTLYIQLRLKPMQAFYAKRIGPAVRRRYLLIILGLICGAVSSILSYMRMIEPLAIPSAFANAFVAWSEFTDIERKIERYNDALTLFDKLLLKWDSLGEVEQASTVNVATLVLTSERIICDEFGAWQAIASFGMKSDEDKKDDNEADSKSKME